MSVAHNDRKAGSIIPGFSAWSTVITISAGSILSHDLVTMHRHKVHMDVLHQIGGNGFCQGP